MYTNCPYTASGFDGPGMFQWFGEPRGRKNSKHPSKPEVKEMLMTGDDAWSLVPKCVFRPNKVASALHTSEAFCDLKPRANGNSCCAAPQICPLWQRSLWLANIHSSPLSLGYKVR